jgi:type IV secretory pathway VirB9-like protein
VYYTLIGGVASVAITFSLISFGESAPVKQNLSNAPLPSESSHDLSESVVRSSPDISVTIPVVKTTIAKQCQKIQWTGNRVYTIKGSMNMATHFVFPESSVDVIVGNKDLWQEEHKLNHVFIKPTTTKSEGDMSTLTFIGESNTSYEFILKRVPDSEAVPCVVISRNGDMLNSANWSNYQNRDKRLVEILSAQFERDKTQIIKQQQNALDKYRGTIYTRYKWKESGTWFAHNFVSDVYDDGRWTYIRVNSDNKGVMSIVGMLEGKTVTLQFTYDETTKMYRVSGIYPKLTLAYGNDTVVIDRQSV